MFHNKTLSNNIKRLHKRYLGIVYSDKSCSYEELLEKDSSIMTKINVK